MAVLELKITLMHSETRLLWHRIVQTWADYDPILYVFAIRSRTVAVCVTQDVRTIPQEFSRDVLCIGLKLYSSKK